jgi:hypothetical protein
MLGKGTVKSQIPIEKDTNADSLQPRTQSASRFVFCFIFYAFSSFANPLVNPALEFWYMLLTCLRVRVYGLWIDITNHRHGQEQE